MLLDMAAEGFGDRVAFGSKRDGMTYAELREQAHRAATWAAGRGVERIGLVDVNSDAVPVLLSHGDVTIRRLWQEAIEWRCPRHAGDRSSERAAGHWRA
jgi:non-ribosomal peptide synthetase component F